MKEFFKMLFVPKLVDNSPKGWIRFGGQTLYQSVLTSAGVMGGAVIVGIILTRYEEKIKRDAIEEYKKTLEITA